MQGVIKELNAKNMSDMGLVMKKTMDITKGAADGSIISETVRNYLK